MIRDRAVSLRPFSREKVLKKTSVSKNAVRDSGTLTIGMNMRSIAIQFSLVLVTFQLSAPAFAFPGRGLEPGRQQAVLRSDFIIEQPPFRQNDSPTIVETREGLLAAWVAGSRDGGVDSAIYISRHDGKSWSEPVEVDDGYDAGEKRFYPCWNPVLYQPWAGPLLLFYRIGTSPEKWWGVMRSSHNAGKTWSEARRLPSDIYGPLRSKPVELDDGSMLCASSSQTAGWRVHVERTRSLGQQWTRTRALNSALEFGAIYPTILQHDSKRLQLLCQTKQQRIAELWSDDGGFTWSRMRRAELPNPNSPVDAVKLRDGRFLLVYNHSATDRGVLNVAVSPDGRRWFAALALENTPGDEFTYPFAIETSDRLVHVVYNWKGQAVKHVIIDPSRLDLREIIQGQWPR
jgi:predicted neuraminidase